MIHSNINQDYSHIEHHKVVDNNGDVNIDDDGMFFCKKNIIPASISSFIIYFIISKLFKIAHTNKEYILVFIITLIISICYYLLWNILPPTYHNYTGMEKYNWIKSNFIYKYLEKYHLIHHLNKGKDKCNFNIILPGIDFLFGTYRGCIDNTEFCNNTVDKTEKEKKICEMQSMNIQPRDDIYYC